MAKQQEVNWDKTNKCWRKYIEGKTYWLCAGKGSSDRVSKKIAIEKVREIRKELAAGKVVDSTRFDTPTSRKVSRKSRKTKTTKRRWSPKQVNAVRNRFIKDKRAEADVGDITYGRVQQLENRLKHFCEYFDRKNLTSINENDINRWSRLASKRVADGHIAPRTLQQEYTSVKQMYTYARKQGLIKNVPLNLEDLGKQTKQQKMRSKKKKRHLFFSKKEVQMLYQHCSTEHLDLKWRERKDTEMKNLKLAICLALNTGMTQQDLSDLTVADLSLKKRPPRVERQRSKTGVESNHLLWRKSVAGLKELCKGKKMTERVFTRNDGQPLVRLSKEPKTGKKTGGRTDVLGAAFKRLVKRVLGEDDPRRFRELRRTGAEMCKQRNPGTEQLYLAHTDRQMSAFYTTPIQKEFDLMLTYLEIDL